MKLYHGTNVNFEPIQDKENELHIQSSAYNYELLKKEYLTANLQAIDGNNNLQ